MQSGATIKKFQVVDLNLYLLRKPLNNDRTIHPYHILNFHFLSQMTNILFGNNSKRRVVTITDQTGSVELKLWGDDMINKITQDGVSVVVKCVTVEHYSNRTSVNSTMSTQIEVNIP